ncbi:MULTISPECIES: anaerobic ribonucleoside-triphosphate reductase activating protein [Cryobacterium]|uniref:anaerobic ribonucleoside-triphosphate reductase activating protein n=1 Tax=Cryobacterium TaxID=69578 RepID=UPI000CD3ABCB|nr:MULTISPECIES: anaerobic ribonucleoside-triphosphate reductase activating protein [Cryobacterium]POH63598.1 anaerobic ribonucleoside-triphosphate reductase activating protein [Cryobacterium zongtaii]TFC42065.1 anaerobic ribonucleoside-triphosphate reductase activating protein [Cryobacterium sp. TMN-39-2]
MRNPNPGEWLSDKLSQGFIGDYKPFMFVDGEGVRCSLYVSGCLFACEGCFNEATWNFRYGTPYTVELEDRILADLAQPYVQGLTLLGGEPFINTGVCLSLVRRVRATFGQAKDIWSWTGYSYEELLLESPDKLELLDQIDILVDGRFDLAKKDFKLQFRGSSNQRIIDVKKSRAAGRAVLWTNLLDATQTYEQLEKQTLI